MDGSFGKFLKPSMLAGEFPVARVEGWILGVMWWGRIDIHWFLIYSLFANRERRMADDSQASRCSCVT
jgi:hypothetical protein